VDNKELDTLLRASDGDVRRVLKNYVMPNGPDPEGWSWISSRLNQLPPQDLLNLLTQVRETAAPGGTEATLIHAIINACPKSEAEQHSYTHELIGVAGQLPGEVVGELLTRLVKPLRRPNWLGLLQAAPLDCCPEYDRLRKTLPRWSMLRTFSASQDPIEVRTDGPEHPAFTLFDDRHDPTAPGRRLSPLLRNGGIEYRAHVLASLEQAKLLNQLRPEDALPADYRFARGWNQTEGEEADDRYGSRAFFVGFARRWARAGEDAAGSWFYDQAAAWALRAGHWEGIEDQLKPWNDTREDRRMLRRAAIERGVPEAWVNPDPWTFIFDFLESARSQRYQWLCNEYDELIGAHITDERPRLFGVNRVLELIKVLPLPPSPDIEFDRRLVAAVSGPIAQSLGLTPRLVLQRLSTRPMTAERANVLIESAYAAPELFAMPEIREVLAAAAPIDPTRCTGVLQLNESERELALLHLGASAADAFGSRIEAGDWTAEQILKLAEEKLANGAAPSDVAQAMLNRTSRVSVGDPNLSRVLEQVERLGVVGKTLFGAALQIASRTTHGGPRWLSAWLVERMSTVNAWKEHGTAVIEATMFANWILLEDVFHAMRRPCMHSESGKLADAIKMALGRFLVTQVKGALAARRLDDARTLLLALGTLCPPEGLSASVAMLRRLENQTADVTDLIDICVRVTKRSGNEVGGYSDIERALEELRILRDRRRDEAATAAEAHWH
jgi:hypothetical protein